MRRCAEGCAEVSRGVRRGAWRCAEVLREVHRGVSLQLIRLVNANDLICCGGDP